MSFLSVVFAALVAGIILILAGWVFVNIIDWKEEKSRKKSQRYRHG